MLKKIILSIVCILIIVGGTGYYFWGSAKKAEGSYVTDIVRQGTILNTISANGTIEPVDTVSLSFENSAVIQKLYVKQGDQVSSGQLLAEQDTANLQAALIQATASLKSAEANLAIQKNNARPEEIAQAESKVTAAKASYELAEMDYQRNEELLQQGFIAQSEFDQIAYALTNAKTNLQQTEESLQLLKAGSRQEEIDAASAQVENSRSQLQMAEKNLAETKMYSPIDGIVSEVNGAEGQRAAANNNTTSGGGLIDIISRELQLRVQINETDMGNLQTGQQVEFTVNAYPEKTFYGIVNSIAPQAHTESNVQLYDTIIQLNDGQTGLMAGMPVNASIIVQKQDNVLTIPKGAVTFGTNYQSTINIEELRENGTFSEGRMLGDRAKTGGKVESADAEKKLAENLGTNTQPPAGNAPFPIADSFKDTVTDQEIGGPAEDMLSSNTDFSSDHKIAMDFVVILTATGQPELRQVVLGMSDLSKYEVVEGLTAGEQVIVGSMAQGSDATYNQGGNRGNAGFMPAGGGGPVIIR